MNVTKHEIVRAGLVVCSVLAVALAGCRTRVIHEHARTVYVPAPPVVNEPPPPQIVYVPSAPPPPEPVVVVVPPAVVVIQSENDFYEPLAAYGSWVVVGSYGRCWVPARVEAGWRPYSNGYWERTDAGWYWASEEPWGWATYHYGRWDFHASHGWIWVPQTQWAPAWVSWREGGGYLGWAPLRPTVRVGVRVDREREPAFDSRAFVFVEHRRMLEPVRTKTVIVNNTTIINKTVNITKVQVVNKTVINEGPRPDVIERESGRKVRAVPVHELRHKEEAPVVARERKVPAAHDRTVKPPARIEHPPTEKPIILPLVAHPVDQPVIQPTRPLVTPVRGEVRRETDVSTTDQAGEPRIKTEPKPKQTVPPRQEVRPVEKPKVTTKPSPQPVPALTADREKKREQVIGKKNTPTPPTVEPRSAQAVNPEARFKTNPPAKVKTTPPPAVKKQTAPPAAKPANTHSFSPKGKANTAEPVKANKNKPDTGNTNKQAEVQVPPVPVDSTQPRR